MADELFQHAELECDDHKITQGEHEFFRSFAVILEHLKNRALKAEAEVRRLRAELNNRNVALIRELETRREQVEYLGGKVGEPFAGLPEHHQPSTRHS